MAFYDYRDTYNELMDRIANSNSNDVETIDSQIMSFNEKLNNYSKLIDAGKNNYIIDLSSGRKYLINENVYYFYSEMEENHMHNLNGSEVDYNDIDYLHWVLKNKISLRENLVNLGSLESQNLYDKFVSIRYSKNLKSIRTIIEKSVNDVMNDRIRDIIWKIADVFSYLKVPGVREKVNIFINSKKNSENINSIIGYFYDCINDGNLNLDDISKNGLESLIYELKEKLSQSVEMNGIIFDKLQKKGLDSYFDVFLNRNMLNDVIKFDDNFFKKIDSEINLYQADSLDLEKQFEKHEDELIEIHRYNPTFDMSVLNFQLSKLKSYKNSIDDLLKLKQQNQLQTNTLSKELFSMSSLVSKSKKEIVNILKKETGNRLKNTQVSGMNLGKYIDEVENIYIDLVRKFCAIEKISSYSKEMKIKTDVMVDGKLVDKNENLQSEFSIFLNRLNDYVTDVIKSDSLINDSTKNKIRKSLSEEQGLINEIDDLKNNNSDGFIKKLQVKHKLKKLKKSQQKMKLQRISYIGKIIVNALNKGNKDTLNIKNQQEIQKLVSENLHYFNELNESGSKHR